MGHHLVVDNMEMVAKVDDLIPLGWAPSEIARRTELTPGEVSVYEWRI